MRRVLSLLVWGALLYSGYWFAGSQALQHGAQSAAVALAEDGVDLDYGSVTVAGYPARFDMALADVSASAAGWGWHAPSLRIEADSYRPLSVNLTFPQEQRVTFAGQSFQVRSDNWQADASVRPNAMLSFDRGQVRMGRTEVVSDQGWQLGLARLDASLALVGGQGASYDARLDAEQIDLPADLRERIDPAGRLGPHVAAVNGAARLTLARPLDRDLQGRLPDLDNIALDDLRFDWGPVSVQLTGDIAIDRAGMPTGQMTLRTRQWQAVVEVLTGAGIIDARIADTVTRLAGYMADADGLLTVPVAFQDGVTLVGLVPVGPAPRLR